MASETHPISLGVLVFVTSSKRINKTVVHGTICTKDGLFEALVEHLKTIKYKVKVLVELGYCMLLNMISPLA